MIFKADMAGDTPYKKFMFDTDFDELAERREKARAKAAAEAAAEKEAAENADEPEAEPEAPTFSEEDLARARDEGLAEGKRLGAEEAASGTEKQIADALSSIAEQTAALFTAQNAANQEVTSQAVAVASALVKKLFPTLNQQTAMDQIQSMLEATLGQASSEPSIIVRVPADLAEDLHERVEAIAELSGFQGEIKVLGDPGLSVGDCRLEWSSGGVQRSAQGLARELDEIVQRNLGAAQAAQGGPVMEDAEASAQPAAEAAPEAAGQEERLSEPAPEPAPAEDLVPAEATAEPVEEINEIEPAEAMATQPEAEIPAPDMTAEPMPEHAPEPAPEPAVDATAVPAADDPAESSAQEPSQELMQEADTAADPEAAADEPADAEAAPEPGAPVPSSQLFEEPAGPTPTDLDTAPGHAEDAPTDDHAPVPSSEAMHEAPPEPEPEEPAEAEPAEDDDSRYINPELLEILEARDAEEEAKD